jgi:hypothetical protein
MESSAKICRSAWASAGLPGSRTAFQRSWITSTRVLSQGGITTAFGPVTGGWQTRKRAADDDIALPTFLVAGSLQEFIPDSLRELVAAPIKYRDPRGGPVRVGLDAGLLPQVCEVWLRARDAKALTKIQLPVADRADILMRGCAFRRLRPPIPTDRDQ